MSAINNLDYRAPKNADWNFINAVAADIIDSEEYSLNETENEQLAETFTFAFAEGGDVMGLIGEREALAIYNALGFYMMADMQLKALDARTKIAFRQFRRIMADRAGDLMDADS